jgi:acyl dehydratase
MLNHDKPPIGPLLACGHTLHREGPLLTQAAFNDFGALLGTDAPIHVDPDYARQTPFGGTIAQGMLLLAPLETWLQELFGEAAWFRSGRLHARLLNPAVVGERATMHLTVTGRGASGVTALDFTLTCGERPLAAGKVEFHGR